MLHQLLNLLTEQDYKVIKNNAQNSLVNGAEPINEDSVARAWVAATVDRLSYIANRETYIELQNVYNDIEAETKQIEE